MAVPFRRTSKTKKRMRRTHLKKVASMTTICANCGATIKPHRMCTKCGFYKGKEIVSQVKEEETKKAPKKEVNVKKNKVMKNKALPKLDTKKVSTKRTNTKRDV